MAKLKFYLYNGGENDVEAVEDVLIRGMIVDDCHVSFICVVLRENII